MKTLCHLPRYGQFFLPLISVILLGFGSTEGDTVQLLVAEYDPGTSTLTVEATSSNPSAVLEVFETESERRIGTLHGDEQGNFTASFPVDSNPGTITVRSSLGGSAMAEVKSL